MLCALCLLVLARAIDFIALMVLAKKLLDNECPYLEADDPDMEAL